MPDDYYVSQYSGEEIDERLTAAHNAVRYDAAQTLTYAQKTQARTNIGAAPAGYGYGEQIQIVYWSDSDGSQLGTYLDNYIANTFPNDKYGVFRISNFVDYPACSVSGNGGYADVYFNKDADDYSKFTVIVSFTGLVDVLDYASGCSYQAVLKRTYMGWKQWEYVNPPMELGKEYRTTERYNGKPVYAKLVDCGAGPNATRKTVSAGISNVDKAVSANGSWGGMSIPYEWFSGDPSGAQAITIALNGGSIEIASTINYSARTIYALIKYTKTTD